MRHAERIATIKAALRDAESDQLDRWESVLSQLVEISDHIANGPSYPVGLREQATQLKVAANSKALTIKAIRARQ